MIIDQPFYRQLYYQLQKNADLQMRKIFETLARSSFYDNTIIIFTSDHGDLLGAHGDLHQKWYSAYEEFLHVPFLIHNRRLFPKSQDVHALTSHVDLIPTMLGLANVNITDIQSRMQNRYSDARPFVGRNLAPQILGHSPSAIVDAPVYFMTDDDVTRGQHQISPLGKPYSSVVQPSHIEMILTYLQRKGRKELWKFSRYFDNPQFWSEPGVQDVTLQPVEGSPGEFTTRVKTEPVPEEFELYNLTEDPLEAYNLAHPTFATQQSRSIQQWMNRLLEEQRNQKRLTPAQTATI